MIPAWYSDHHSSPPHNPMELPFWITYGLLWGLVVMEAAAIFALYNQLAQAYLSSRTGREKQGPAVGSTFETLNLKDVNGHQRAIPSPGRPTLLILASTTCPICASLRSDLVTFAATHDDIGLTVVCEGKVDEVRHWADRFHHILPVIPDRSYRLPTKLNIGMTPFVIGVDETGVVRVRGLVNEGAGLEWAARETLALLDDDEPLTQGAGNHV